MTSFTVAVLETRGLGNPRQYCLLRPDCGQHTGQSPYAPLTAQQRLSHSPAQNNPPACHPPPSGTWPQHTSLWARGTQPLLTSNSAIDGGLRHGGEGAGSLCPATQLCTVRYVEGLLPAEGPLDQGTRRAGKPQV